MPYSYPAGCPDGWVRFEYQRYQVVDGPSEWDDSEREFGWLDSKLVVVHNETTKTERQFLASLTSNTSWLGRLSSSGVPGVLPSHTQEM